jgi:hypothetical protein
MNDGVQEMMEQAQTLGRLWMDTLSRMTGAAFAFTPGSTPPEATRQVRDAFLSSVGHSFDAYMRSEPFMRAMKQSLDVSMEMRKQFSEMMNRMHHSMGMVAEEDIRSVMLGIRHTEERLSRRMDQVLSRLERIEARLDAASRNGRKPVEGERGAGEGALEAPEADWGRAGGAAQSVTIEKKNGSFNNSVEK